MKKNRARKNNIYQRDNREMLKEFVERSRKMGDALKKVKKWAIVLEKIILIRGTIKRNSRCRLRDHGIPGDILYIRSHEKIMENGKTDVVGKLVTRQEGRIEIITWLNCWWTTWMLSCRSSATANCRCACWHIPII